jgi:hypothetical protein
MERSSLWAALSNWLMDGSGWSVSGVVPSVTL